MINVEGVQVCYKCKKTKHHSEFYAKGNRYLSCAVCRRKREKRRMMVERLLEKDKYVNQRQST